MKFRKIPVVIDAVQYTGDNLAEVIAFTGKHPKFDEWFASWEEYEAHVKADRQAFKIVTLEGTMEAMPGDWIIRGVHGEHYPCKPDIFAKTYELADARCDRSTGSEPLTYCVTDQQMRDIEASLKVGLEAVQSELHEHDRLLGRTTTKNRMWAQSLEQQIGTIKSALAGLPNTKISNAPRL